MTLDDGDAPIRPCPTYDQLSYADCLVRRMLFWPTYAG